MISESGASVTKNGINIMNAEIRNGLYVINLKEISETNYSLLSSHVPTPTIANHHKRLAHANCDLIKKAIERELITGLKLNKSDTADHICEGCLMGKCHRLKNRKIVRDMIPIKIRHPTTFGQVLCVMFQAPLRYLLTRQRIVTS